jgi:hypothetical protein
MGEGHIVAVVEDVGPVITLAVTIRATAMSVVRAAANSLSLDGL